MLPGLYHPSRSSAPPLMHCKSITSSISSRANESHHGVCTGLRRSARRACAMSDTCNVAGMASDREEELRLLRERILSYVKSRLHDRAEAEDVAQEVFLRLHRDPEYRALSGEGFRR